VVERKTVRHCATLARLDADRLVTCVPPATWLFKLQIGF
jgi:hypothetical protein